MPLPCSLDLQATTATRTTTRSIYATRRLKSPCRPEGVELEVRLKDGRLLREYVPVALGEPSNPLSREGLAAKFMTQVEDSQTVSMSDAEELLKLLARLEDVGDVGRLGELAVKRG